MQKCAELHELLRIVAFMLFIVGTILLVAHGFTGKTLMLHLVRLFVLTALLVMLPQWGNQTQPFRLVENMADRFRKHGEAFFLFITTPGMEPTNNLAEQAIRFIVIGRRVTQGTRGQNGREFCQRIWTTWATCKIQGRLGWKG